MSVETIAIVISAAGLLLALIGTFAAGLSWLIRRTDEQFSALRRELGEEIKGVRHELGHEIKGVRQELVEVKIAIARIEGPGRHLVSAR